MKVVFTSSNFDSPSFIFYADSFKKINTMNLNCKIEIKKIEEINYISYDIALFMGFLDKSVEAKQKNPEIFTGIIEPRADQKNSFINTDFIVVNSLESKDYFSKFHSNLFLYYTFPEVPLGKLFAHKKDKIVLGYHGNKIHLNAMYPRILSAINKLSDTMPVELWAMYNFEKLGK
jgi:hypothetical protein